MNNLHRPFIYKCLFGQLYLSCKEGQFIAQYKTYNTYVDYNNIIQVELRNQYPSPSLLVVSLDQSICYQGFGKKQLHQFYNNFQSDRYQYQLNKYSDAINECYSSILLLTSTDIYSQKKIIRECESVLISFAHLHISDNVFESLISMKLRRIKKYVNEVDKCSVLDNSYDSIVAINQHQYQLNKYSGDIDKCYKNLFLLISEDIYPRKKVIEEWKRQCKSVLDSFTDFDSANLAESSSLLKLRKIEKYFNESHNYYDLECSNFWIGHTKAFITKEMRKLPDSNLNNYQKTAVIIDEDRVFVNAAAGTGKTTTIISKIEYILDSKLAQIDEILVLVYNKDARGVLQKRLGLVKEDIAHTFHSYGLKVLNEQTQDKKKVVDKEIALIKNNALAETLKQTELRDAMIEIFLIENRKGKLPHDFDSLKAYRNHCIENAHDIDISGSTKTQPTTIDEIQVRSHEETEIANFLAFNSVEYEYEKKYEIDLEYSYSPDFYLPKHKIYIEHFAVNSRGEAPPFFKNPTQYIKDISSKKATHKKYKTKLIETYSYQKENGTLLSGLKEKLIEHKVRLVYNEEKYHTKLVFNVKSIFYSCLGMYKSNQLNIKELKLEAENDSDATRIKKFLKAFIYFERKYTEGLKSREKLIDFDDMIVGAIDKIKHNNFVFERSLKYILVDEFQDTSKGRKELIDSVLEANTECKLFAVGDDWQSINGFSGSDLSYATEFKKYYNYSITTKLLTTFRFNSDICQQTSKFIQQNPYQTKKDLKAEDLTVGKKVTIVKVASCYRKNYSEEASEQSQVLRVLNDLDSQPLQDRNKKTSVFILARYHSKFRDYLQKDSDKLLSELENYTNLTIQAQTIHSSKGLEADYVIVLGVKSGILALPSEIENDPIIKVFSPNSDGYLFSEERRVFYVAITRAKKHVYIMSDIVDISHFTQNLIDQGVHVQSQAEDCTKCKIGFLVKKKNKKTKEMFLGCVRYSRLLDTCEYSHPSK
jgi:DNA helicase-4